MATPNFARDELPGLLETVDKLAAVFETFTQAQVFCRVATAGEGTPPDVSEIARALKLPMSTLSRVAYELTQRKLLAYELGSDRRKKYLILGKAWSKARAQKSSTPKTD